MCVQLPCPCAAPANNAITITAAVESLAHIFVAPQGRLSGSACNNVAGPLAHFFAALAAVGAGNAPRTDIAASVRRGERAVYPYRPHHVVLFVLEDMAVPDVLMASSPRA